MIPSYKIELPEYVVGQTPDYASVGRRLDETLIHNFNGKHIAIRCLSLRDHPSMSLEQLIETISKTGTDKYDPSREMSVAHDFYTEKGVELFAIPCRVDENAHLMGEAIKDFYEGALEDRGYPMRVDLMVIYDMEQLELVPIDYDGKIGDDAYKFKNLGNRADAVLGFISVL